MARKHNARTLQHCRERGWLAERCHYFVSFNRPQKRGEKFKGAAGRAVDLFGIADSVLIRPGQGTVYIQSAGPNDPASAHIKKYNGDLETLAACQQILANNRIQIWEWKKVDRVIERFRKSDGRPLGKAKMKVWRARIHHLHLDENGWLAIRKTWWSDDR